MKYSGTFEDLENIVKTAGIKIKESKSLSLNSSGGYQIRTSNGGIINWYGSTGTLQIQGKDLAAKKLKEDLTPYLRETSTTPSPIALSNIPKTSSNISESPSKKIFIAHGHDHTALEQLELILLKLGLNPYILKNTSGNGLTIIEALEKEICKPTSSVKFGIVLLTPDDMGYAKSDGETKAQPRARQNVILEMGMLTVALTRKNVAILRKEGVETPSNFGGLIYIPFNEHIKETVPTLADQLMEAGFTLDPKAITLASR
ncbi:nucleotide-binding protein [Bartonella krasnovii]|uniref:TIR domain-containing protein n=1 Tax=Bartonella krasnovii TaxID=2267275 RepID=UPI001F4CFE86|nr:TIR domain-containing protein [Bartonella krasnovii]UNF41999.1 nucleotide-binding protein [Bartonella krasnovii]UNF43654.1 nucleotide-binding protein [Bartonella krasnovii]UNF55205.1 nucleotide-binding protein [Bartonella krasnovii]